MKTLTLCLCLTVWTSFYGSESGDTMANGEPFVPSELVAASWHYPFGSVLRLSYEGRTVDVTIKDRGPAAWTGRDLDVSQGAAERLGFAEAGVVDLQVEIRTLGPTPIRVRPGG